MALWLLSPDATPWRVYTDADGVLWTTDEDAVGDNEPVEGIVLSDLNDVEWLLEVGDDGALQTTTPVVDWPSGLTGVHPDGGHIVTVDTDGSLLSSTTFDIFVEALDDLPVAPGLLPVTISNAPPNSLVSFSLLGGQAPIFADGFEGGAGAWDLAIGSHYVGGGEGGSDAWVQYASPIQWAENLAKSITGIKAITVTQKFRCDFPSDTFDAGVYDLGGGSSTFDDTMFGFVSFWAGSRMHAVLHHTGGGTWHMSRMTGSPGHLDTTAGDGGTLDVQSGYPISANVWHDLSVAFGLGDSDGHFSVLLDGVEILSGSGLDTRNAGATDLINLVKFGPMSIGSIRRDDIVITAYGTTWTEEVLLADYFEATTDSTGALTGASVPISIELAAGAYTLRVNASGLAGEDTFIVLTDPEVRPTAPGADVLPDDPGYVNKWAVIDPVTNTPWQFPYNPTQMTTPHAPKAYDFETTTAPDGQILTWEGAGDPVDWKLTGYIDTQAAYQQLEDYVASNRRWVVVDHRGRAWVCIFEEFETSYHRSVGNDWSFDYELTLMILKAVTL